MRAGDVTESYFRDNQALNGASVWQNDCPRVVHSGSRFDNNAALQARRAAAAAPRTSRLRAALLA